MNMWGIVNLLSLCRPLWSGRNGEAGPGGGVWGVGLGVTRRENPPVTEGDSTHTVGVHRT